MRGGAAARTRSRRSDACATPGLMTVTSRRSCSSTSPADPIRPRKSRYAVQHRRKTCWPLSIDSPS